MKIKDIIHSVDKSTDDGADLYNLAEEMGLPSPDNYHEQQRLKSYYIAEWDCSNSRVGIKVYFLDDVPVAIGTQPYRKSSEEIEWVSKECFAKVRDFIKSFEVESNHEAYLDLETEFGSHYHIEFYCQLYEHHKKNAIYEGKSVTVLNGVKDSPEDSDHIPMTLVNIAFADGTTKVARLKDVCYPINIVQ